MIKTINCICCGVKTSEKETLPILFSQKIKLYEKSWFGEFIGAYGIEYFYCEKCNQVKVYRCSLSENEVAASFMNLDRAKEHEYYIKNYDANPVGTKLTSVSNPIDVLKEILEGEYGVSKKHCMIPCSVIKRLPNITQEEYEIAEGIVYNKELGIYENIEIDDFEITSDEEFLNKKEDNISDFSQFVVQEVEKIYDSKRFITNTDAYSNLDINSFIDGEIITKGIQLHINKKTFDKILNLNNLKKEDLICRENIKNDVMWDYFKTVLD